MSHPPRLLAHTMTFGVHDTLHKSHVLQPASKSNMGVDNQLRAFPVTQPPPTFIFQSNQLLAFPSSDQMPRLDNFHTCGVTLRHVAVINSTTSNACLRGTAAHDKNFPQFSDVIDAVQSSIFYTPSSMCLQDLSAEPTRSSAPATLWSFKARRWKRTPATPPALHCLILLSGFRNLHITAQSVWRVISFLYDGTYQDEEEDLTFLKVEPSASPTSASRLIGAPTEHQDVALVQGFRKLHITAQSLHL
ncbi:hypothetical protein KCU65_g5691, partial [Aureobasidium melanogenum]